MNGPIKLRQSIESKGRGTVFGLMLVSVGVASAAAQSLKDQENQPIIPERNKSTQWSDIV